MSKPFKLIWQLLSQILDGLKNLQSLQQGQPSQPDSELSDELLLKLSVLKVTLRDNTQDTVKGYVEDIPMRWQGIVIHHSLTKDGTSKNWNAIIKYHKSWAYQGVTITQQEGEKLVAEGKRVKRPWSDVGYHFCIEQVNGEWIVFAGRSLDKKGAHTKELDFNAKFIGICIIGDFDKTQPPPEALSLCESLVEILQDALDVPVENVLGHGEAQKIARVVKPKTCPGLNFDMGKFRVKLRIANALIKKER